MLTIETDNTETEIIYGFYLTPEQRKEFDFLDDEELDSSQFFMYNGEPYYIGNFMVCNGIPEFKDWHGYQHFTAFNGLVIKLIENEAVIVGRYSS